MITELRLKKMLNDAIALQINSEAKLGCNYNCTKKTRDFIIAETMVNTIKAILEVE